MFGSKASKIIVSLMLAGVAVSAVLTACGNSSTAPTNTKDTAGASQNAGSADKEATPATITWWFGNMTPDKDERLNPLMENFNKVYPHIKIDFLGYPEQPGEKIRVALAADSPPDVAYGADQAISIFGAEAFIPLDDYLENSPLKGKINENALQTVRSLNRDGKLYAIPTTQNVWCLWVRSDWFEEAKVKIPETWDEFFDAAVKMTDKANGKYGFSLRAGDASGVGSLENLMYSYSGIKEVITAEGKATINDPLHVEFLEKFLGLYNVATSESDVTNTFREVQAAFQSGKAAIIVHNLVSGVPNSIAFDNDLSKFQAIPFPKSVKGYTNIPGVIPTNWPIFKASKNPQAAWTFVEFLAGKESVDHYGKHSGEIPLNIDSANESWVKETPWTNMALNLLNAPDTQVYVAPLYLPEYSGMRAGLVGNLQKVILGDMSARDFLDDWAEQLEQAKADFDANFKQ